MSKEEAVKSPVAEGEIVAGKYKIEKILGVGGMGVVVAAMHQQLRQRVAIKFLLPNAGAELVTRFMREARASAKLKSEHITRVIDVAELPDSKGNAPYMVMEYLDGSDLSRVLRKRGALPLADAIDYLLQACEAIAEAHSVGIVHRDLKPANLFLTKSADGSACVKVLDFGISKDTSEETGEDEMELTRTTAVLGSPYYMAPEQMRSTRTVDARADIWSIGIILYQLLTKAVPFKAGAFVELALMVINDEPLPPTKLEPSIPPTVEEAILRCLRKNPAERFATVAELALAIAPFGRASALASAERIARTQGAPMPYVERNSGASIAPPPPSAVSGSAHSVGSALSSGPSINLPTPTPGLGPPSVLPALAAAAQAHAASEVPRPHTMGPSIATKQGIGPAPLSPSAVSVSPVVSVNTGPQTAPQSGLAVAPQPGPPVAGSLEAALARGSTPPPGATTGNAATASTWAGAPAAPPRKSSAKTFIAAGVLLGALAVGGTAAVLRTRTGPAAAAQSAPTAPEVTAPTAAPPAPTTAPTTAAREPAPTATAALPPARTEPSPGPLTPAVGAPIATTTTSPGGKLAPKASAAPQAPAPPTATAVAVAPPVAPPPPPPAATPAPAATAAPKKKGVLDMDIQ